MSVVVEVNERSFGGIRHRRERKSGSQRISKERSQKFFARCHRVIDRFFAVRVRPRPKNGTHGDAVLTNRDGLIIGLTWVGGIGGFEV